MARRTLACAFADRRQLWVQAVGIPVLVAMPVALLALLLQRPSASAPALLAVLASALVIGWGVHRLVLRARRSQAESETISRLVASIRPDLGVKNTLQTVGAALLRYFAADSVLIALQQKHERQLNLWNIRINPGGQVSAEFSQPSWEGVPEYFFPLAGDVVEAVRHRPSGELAAVFSLDLNGNAVAASGAFPGSWREFRRCVAGTFITSQELSARIFLTSTQPGRTSLQELRWLQRALHALGGALANAYVSCRLRWMAPCEERMRVARELHDGAIQSLVAAEMQLEVVRREHSLRGCPFVGSFAPVQKTLRTQVAALRELMQHTRTFYLSPAEFLGYVQHLGERFQQESGIHFELRTELDGTKPIGLPDHSLGELARIVQEAMVNARKHSGATNLRVHLDCKDGCALVRIEDDGRGFDFHGRRSLAELDAARQGPAIIKERVRKLGGDLIIDSSSGGVRLEISVPCLREAACA